MKMIKKFTQAGRYCLAALPLGFVTKSAFATDLLNKALEGNIQDSFGEGANFWKIFTLVSIMLATAAAVSTKNPMVFLGVMAVAFIPTFLIRAFVF